MSTHDTSPTAEADATTDADTAGALADRPEYRNLRRWNGAMAVLHFLQGALIVVLADVRWPITRVRYGFDPATETIAPVSVEWAEVDFVWEVSGEEDVVLIVDCADTSEVNELITRARERDEVMGTKTRLILEERVG